jgi:hypothetical protein
MPVVRTLLGWVTLFESARPSADSLQGEESAMTMTAPSLFEREMRAQVAAAEAGVVDAEAAGDPLLVDAAQGHLEGLIDLARRNGLEIVMINIAEQPAAS